MGENIPNPPVLRLRAGTVGLALVKLSRHASRQLAWPRAI